MFKFPFSTTILGAVLAMSLGNASASEWQLIIGESTAQRFYVFDASSVEKEKGVVRVWIKHYRLKTPARDDAWITASREEYNCAKRTIIYRAASDYDKLGEFRRSLEPGKTPEPIRPDSVAESLWELVCKKDFPLNRSDADFVKVAGNDMQRFYAQRLKLAEQGSDTAPK